MGVSDHWQYQGRQDHGWFGHGTAPDRACCLQPVRRPREHRGPCLWPDS